MKIPLYFCDIQNFGDQFNLDLFRHLGFDPFWADPRAAKVVGCGSVLGHVAANRRIVIFGSGMHSPFKHALLHGELPLCRGPYTRGLIFGPLSRRVGDPGLLASRIWPSRGSELAEKARRARGGGRRVGLLPHLNDRSSRHFRRLSKQDGLQAPIIDPADSPSEVATQIRECDVVVSSSLHGIIFAHSYGKPAVWVRESQREPGCGFKFYDYFGSVGLYVDQPIQLL